jgi:hypothetical protein
VLLHLFDDIDEVIADGTIDSEFNASNILLGKYRRMILFPRERIVTAIHLDSFQLRSITCECVGPYCMLYSFAMLAKLNFEYDV